MSVLTQNIGYFQAKPADLAKTTILLDQGYYPKTIQQALEQAQGKSGFVPVAVRWVYACGGAKPYERFNAWVERCKNLVKNFEWTLEHARTKLNLCFIRLMVKRLAA